MSFLFVVLIQSHSLPLLFSQSRMGGDIKARRGLAGNTLVPIPITMVHSVVCEVPPSIPACPIINHDVLSFCRFNPITFTSFDLFAKQDGRRYKSKTGARRKLSCPHTHNNGTLRDQKCRPDKVSGCGNRKGITFGKNTLTMSVPRFLV